MQVTHRGNPQPDTLDGADGVTDIHHVAHPILVLEQHEYPGNEVPHQVLRAEAKRNADDARGCDEGCDVHSQNRQRLQDHPDQHQKRDRRLENRPEGLRSLRPPLPPARIASRVLCAPSQRARLRWQSRGLVQMLTLPRITSATQERPPLPSGMFCRFRPPRALHQAVDRPMQHVSNRERQNDVDGDVDRPVNQPIPTGL
ncbi:Uncharacterised protein [Mycobacteroides abscessus subsp. massiliense]|nr:Uncharacterised protein [Mycobacteroides abscessus subsp. massiliense]